MSARSVCLVLACVLLVLGATALPGSGKPAAPAGPEVTVSQPLAREVTDHEDFTGRVEPVQSVEVRARVGGMLDKVDVRAGSAVKQGDLLFEIDPRPYQLELEKADAELHRAEAHLKRASADLERAKALLAKQAIGREDFDRIEAERTEAEPAVQVAKAARELAQLNVSFTKVTAPIAGKIGRLPLGAGNLISADATPLGTIVSTDAVYVAFDVDERTAVRLARMKREGKADGDADLPVQMAVATEKDYPRRGKVAFVDNHVDPATGTIRWQAIFPNPDGTLLPGMHARIRLTLGAPYKALLVPEAAVGTDQGQNYLYVVTDKNIVERRTVKLGPRHDGLQVVEEGLTAGEWVIVKSAPGVEPGKTVKPKKVPLPEPGAREESGDKQR
jgi:RND family efflux transporter MFP subunit